MYTIIVCTDFSDTSHNALDYTCNMVKDKAKEDGVELLLLHVFSIPRNYAGEGISLVTIESEWSNAEQCMNEELQWVNEQFPGIAVRSKLTDGSLADSLREQIIEEDASLISIGAGGNYGDLWSWDKEILDLLRGLPVPVLTVPKTVSFSPIQNIAFACNLKNVTPALPFETLKNMVRFTGATLHVLFVTTPEINKMLDKQNEALVHENLKEIDAVYHVENEAKVINAIGHFIHENDINLLLVTPKKHGVWENLFHKSNTRELMRLNSIPIIALHGR